MGGWGSALGGYGAGAATGAVANGYSGGMSGPWGAAVARDARTAPWDAQTNQLQDIYNNGINNNDSSIILNNSNV